MEKRPGREQSHVTGSTNGPHRVGNGLGTGPVGSKDGYSSKKTGGMRPNDGNGGSGRKTVTRATGGIGSLAIIGIIIYFLFGNKLGLNTTTTNDDGGDTSGYESSGESQVDHNVASGSRAKYTTIKGKGKDTVTIMVYMCGTDLESKSGMASNDLQEMADASYDSNVNVLVYTGGCKRWKTSGISNTTNQIYKVEKGNIRCLEKDMGNKSMVKPDTLTEFIKYCTKNFSANRYELILWDHGGGSVSGYGYDEKNSSGSMTLGGINTALKNAGVKFDFIGFDACLMATAENALMLDEYADYLIASEETEPGIGWYYTNWLNEINKNTSIDTIDLGKVIIDDFVSTCNKKCKGQKTTLSIVDLAEFANTVPDDLTAFAKSVGTKLDNDEYQAVSTARSGAREFATSSRIDQVDLVDLAQRMGTKEGKELSKSIQNAVKYNRTSSNMSNCYGVSIFFPYQRTNTVDSACNTYNQIGMDDEYSSLIRQFASMETGGQVAAGGSENSVVGSLLGGLISGGSSGSSDLISGLLSSFLGGGRSINGLDKSNTDFMKELDVEKATEYYAKNYLDTSKLVIRNVDGKNVISLEDSQWDIVADVHKNMFFDDGEGYIDLGLDNLYTFADNGDMIVDLDKTWLAINGQPVAYYHTGTEEIKGETVIHGYVPAFLNGDRVELQIEFNKENPDGCVTGAAFVYKNQETDTVAKNMTELNDNDVIELIADYYDYDGNYQDSYKIGTPITVQGTLQVSAVAITGPVRMMYRFTDMYNQEYWTAPVEK